MELGIWFLREPTGRPIVLQSRDVRSWTAFPINFAGTNNYFEISIPINGTRPNLFRAATQYAQFVGLGDDRCRTIFGPSLTEGIKLPSNAPFKVQPGQYVSSASRFL